MLKGRTFTYGKSDVVGFDPRLKDEEIPRLLNGFEGARNNSTSGEKKQKVSPRAGRRRRATREGIPDVLHLKKRDLSSRFWSWFAKPGAEWEFYLTGNPRALGWDVNENCQTIRKPR